MVLLLSSSVRYSPVFLMCEVLILGASHHRGTRLAYLGHPFDLTKVRLQTAQKGAYTGAFDVVKKTLARDGVKGYV